MSEPQVYSGSEGLPKEEFYNRLRNMQTTDNWDVLVSYSEDSLNALLRKHWGKFLSLLKMQFTTEESIPGKLLLTREYNLKLSPPTLQFPGGPFAVLSMYVNGYIKSTTTDEAKKPVGSEKTIIPDDTYRLRIYVPITAISGDQIHHAGKTIHFGSETKEFAFIFHFKAENMSCEIQPVDGKKRDATDSLATCVNEIQAHFQNKENVDWIDLSIAKISNHTYPSAGSNLDMLRPRSFILSSQPGCLLVFISTLHDSGAPRPAFRHVGKGDMAPFSAGYEASIIISQRLYIQFLMKALKEKLSHEITSISSTKIEGGFCLDMFLHVDMHWLSLSNKYYTIPEMDVPLDSFKLSLTLKDDEKLNTTSTWTWDLEAKRNWESRYVGARWGVTKITGSLSESSSTCWNLVGDELQMTVALLKNKQIPTWFEAIDTSTLFPDYVPDPMRASTFYTPLEVKAQPEGLNFVSTQNVFVPGVRFIEASTVIMPSDVVILCKMPHVKEKRLVKADSALASMSLENLTAQLLDDMYHDNYFLADLINAVAEGNTDDIESLMTGRGYSSVNHKDVLNFLRTRVTPGPEFDIRYAGGVYDVKASGRDTSAQQIFVNSVHRTIYIDDEPVEDQVIQPDGSVSFTSRDGQLQFSIVFNIPINETPEREANSFEGHVWKIAQADKKDAIAGRQVLPWNKEPSLEDRPESTLWTKAFEYLPVALDLVSSETGADASNASIQAGFLEALGTVSIVNGLLTLDKNVKDAYGRYKGYCKSFKNKITRKGASGYKEKFKYANFEAMERQLPEIAERTVNDILAGDTGSPRLTKEEVFEKSKTDIKDAMKEYLCAQAEMVVGEEMNSVAVLDQDLAEKYKNEQANAQGDKVFDGDAYDAYVDKLVDRSLDVRDARDARTHKGLIQERIRQQMEKIQHRAAERKSFEKVLTRKKKEFEDGELPKEEYEKLKEEYEREIDQAEKDIEKHEEKLDKERKESQRSDNDIADAEEREKEHRKEEKEKHKDLWKDRKEHFKPKPKPKLLSNW